MRGFRLSHDFDTSSYYDLCPPRAVNHTNYPLPDNFHALWVSRRLTNKFP